MPYVKGPLPMSMSVRSFNSCEWLVHSQLSSPTRCLWQRWAEFAEAGCPRVKDILVFTMRDERYKSTIYYRGTSSQRELVSPDHPWCFLLLYVSLGVTSTERHQWYTNQKHHQEGRRLSVIVHVYKFSLPMYPTWTFTKLCCQYGNSRSRWCIIVVTLKNPTSSSLPTSRHCAANTWGDLVVSCVPCRRERAHQIWSSLVGGDPGWRRH
jgi:hypothetical protein